MPSIRRWPTVWSPSVAATPSNWTKPSPRSPWSSATRSPAFPRKSPAPPTTTAASTAAALPRRVLLAGGGANLPYTLEFFQEKLNLPVEYFNPVRNVTIGKGVDPAVIQREGHLMGELVGLGLRGIGKSAINIDLVPQHRGAIPRCGPAQAVPHRRGRRPVGRRRRMGGFPEHRRFQGHRRSPSPWRNPAKPSLRSRRTSTSF